MSQPGSKKWMIYGANGFSGALIAREAKLRGLTPILAGRNRDAILALGQELGLETRAFACVSTAEVAEGLQGIDLVIHCAGPFSATSKPMLEGCLKSKTHYLDITGEISVFEAIHSQAARVRGAGIVAIPGVGFDVVPSDCLAALLKESLPTADHLALGFKSSGTLSPGTVKTMIEGLGQGGAIRRDGKIVQVPPAYKVREIVFERKPRTAVTIGWGDVSTAFYSTGIPNIEVYLAGSRSMIRSMKLMSLIRAPLATSLAQRTLKRIAETWVKGPDENARNSGYCILWGEVTDISGQKAELRLKVPEAYSFTADAALGAASRVLQGTVPAGTWTPSKAFGSRFVTELAGTELRTSE